MIDTKCEQCGVCCKLFLINLNEDEYYSGIYKTINSDFGPCISYDEVEKFGLNFLEQNKDGSCIYLKGKGCSIHSVRPQVCRDFFCTTKDPEYADMVKEINEYKHKDR